VLFNEIFYSSKKKKKKKTITKSMLEARTSQEEIV
jgi:hypothetical protein